jgi:hypothetical protein
MGKHLAVRAAGVLFLFFCGEKEEGSRAGEVAALRVRRCTASLRFVSPLRRLPFLLAQKKGSKNCAFWPCVLPKAVAKSL